MQDQSEYNKWMSRKQKRVNQNALCIADQLSRECHANK